MYKLEVKVGLKEGLHARPAANFVKLAGSFQASITLEKEGKSANAKSMMGLMSLGVFFDDTICICGDGEDAEAAVNALAELVSNQNCCE